MLLVGNWGWVNIHAIQSVEKREGGHAVIRLIDGTEIALLPGEAAVLEGELERQRIRPPGSWRPMYETR